MSQANPVVKLVAPAQFAGGPAYWSVDGVMIQAQDAASAIHGLYGTAMTFYTGPISNSPTPAGPNAPAVLASPQLGPPQPGSLMATQVPVYVSVSNLTHPGLPFQVGDQYLVSIQGAPNQPVTMLGLLNGVVNHGVDAPFGNTDSTGNFVVGPGSITAAQIGDHTQTWYVGSVSTVVQWSVVATAIASSTNAAAGGTAGGRSAGTQPQSVNQFSSVNAGSQSTTTSPPTGSAGTSTNAQQQGVVAATAASSIMDYMPLILVGAGVLVLMSMGKR